MTVELMAKSKDTQKNWFIWFCVCFCYSIPLRALSQNRSFQSDYIISIFTRDKSSFITIIFVITAATTTNTISSSTGSSRQNGIDLLWLLIYHRFTDMHQMVCSVNVCTCVCVHTDWASIVCYLIFNMLAIRSWSRNGHNGKLQKWPLDFIILWLSS